MGYSLYYCKLKDLLGYAYLSRFMPERADYCIENMPNLEIEG